MMTNNATPMTPQTMSTSRLGKKNRRLAGSGCRIGLGHSTASPTNDRISTTPAAHPNT